MSTAADYAGRCEREKKEHWPFLAGFAASGAVKRRGAEPELHVDPAPRLQKPTVPTERILFGINVSQLYFSIQNQVSPFQISCCNRKYVLLCWITCMHRSLTEIRWQKKANLSNNQSKACGLLLAMVSLQCCPKVVRRTLDKNLSFHKVCAYMICFATGFYRSLASNLTTSLFSRKCKITSQLYENYRTRSFVFVFSDPLLVSHVQLWTFHERSRQRGPRICSDVSWRFAKSHKDVQHCEKTAVCSFHVLSSFSRHPMLLLCVAKENKAFAQHWASFQNPMTELVKTIAGVTGVLITLSLILIYSSATAVLRLWTIPLRSELQMFSPKDNFSNRMELVAIFLIQTGSAFFADVHTLRCSGSLIICLWCFSPH